MCATYGSKVVTRNTFHGDPRPRWRAMIVNASCESEVLSLHLLLDEHTSELAISGLIFHTKSQSLLCFPSS